MLVYEMGLAFGNNNRLPLDMDAIVTLSWSQDYRSNR
jgi:hypothetical protein